MRNIMPTETKPPKLPFDKNTTDSMDLRLGQEMARSARDYDNAIKHLKGHHVKMTSAEAEITGKISKLEPSIKSFLDSGKLDKAAATDCLEFLDLCAKLYETREAKRLCYGATVKPGEQVLGHAIGDPDHIPKAELQAIEKCIVVIKGFHLPWFKPSGSKPSKFTGPGLNAKATADTHGITIHESQTRVHRGQNQEAHLASHKNPQVAAKALHTTLAAAGGTVGNIRQSEMRHVDGSAAHMYSFDHVDTAGTKHTFHIMRPAVHTEGHAAISNVSPATPGQPAPKPQPTAAKPAPTASAPSTPSTPSTPKVSTPTAQPQAQPSTATPTAPSSSMPKPVVPNQKPYSPTKRESFHVFSHGFTEHHKAQGSIPRDLTERDHALQGAWAKHQEKFPREATPVNAGGMSPYSPTHQQSEQDFETGFIQHHAKQGTLPDTPKARDRAVRNGWIQHNLANLPPKV